MKKIAKDLIPAFVLSFVTSFMLFIYEPISLYASNMDDFWFDLGIMNAQSIKMFFIVFFAFIILFWIIYSINELLLKKTKLYNISLIIGYIVFIILYIHGNILTGALPALNGSTINWMENMSMIYTSSILAVVVIGLFIFLSIKFKTTNVVKYSNYIICAVFAMLTVSLLTTLTTTKNLYVKKVTSVPTVKNLENYSNNKNFIIFLLDATDSRSFDKEVNNNKEFNNLFDDFTYYPDTMSAYAFTRDSIPFIISGEWNENKTDFITYTTEAYTKSNLLKSLYKKKYELNNYDCEITINDESMAHFSNYQLLNRNVDFISFFKQILKYDMYKYSPYLLKKYSKVEYMDFGLCRETTEQVEPFGWSNDYFYNRLTTNEFTKNDKNQFKFIHIEGGHVPFNLDKNLKPIENGTYAQKIDSSLTTVKKYFEKLKENSLYDNSVIIVMADHGYNNITQGLEGRQNPILYIKGINEKHKMIKSDIPVSYTDLQEAYQELMNDKSSKELFNNISKDRKRRFLMYDYTKEDHMVEYEQTGKAWENDTMKKTGNEFNR